MKKFVNLRKHNKEQSNTSEDSSHERESCKRKLEVTEKSGFSPEEKKQNISVMESLKTKLSKMSDSDKLSLLITEFFVNKERSAKFEEKLEKKFTSIEKKIEEIDFDLEMIKRNDNKKKIRISGLQIEENDNFPVLEEKVKKVIKDMQIDEIIEIETIKKAGRPGRRSIVIELQKMKDKAKIMREKGKLRGNEQYKNIYLNNELTRYEAESERVLRAEGVKRKKTNANIHFFIKFGVLTIKEGENITKIKIDKEGKFINI